MNKLIIAMGILSCFCAVYSFIICVLMKDIKIRIALIGLTCLNIVFALMNFSNEGVIK